MHKVLSLHDMPVMAEGKNKRQINSAQIVNIIKENTKLSEEIVVVVSKLMLCPDKELQACSILGKLLVQSKEFVSL